MNITKFLRSVNGCFCTSNHKVSNKIWASLLNQKHDVGRFLLGRFLLAPWCRWRRSVMIITTAQVHSTKRELRFCAGSYPARGVSVIRDGEESLTVVPAGNKA